MNSQINQKNIFKQFFIIIQNKKLNKYFKKLNNLNPS